MTRPNGRAAGGVYRAPDGREPVREFVDALDPRRRALLLHQLGRLNTLSDLHPHLPFPHSSQIDGKLRELRCHAGRDQYRILYRRSAQLLVLLHAFRKATGKVPAGELATAAARFEDFKVRMDAEPRRPPRPAGRDAPKAPRLTKLAEVLTYTSIKRP